MILLLLVRPVFIRWLIRCSSSRYVVGRLLPHGSRALYSQQHCWDHHLSVVPVAVQLIFCQLWDIVDIFQRVHGAKRFQQRLRAGMYPQHPCQAVVQQPRGWLWFADVAGADENHPRNRLGISFVYRLGMSLGLMKSRSRGKGSSQIVIVQRLWLGSRDLTGPYVDSRY